MRIVSRSSPYKCVEGLPLFLGCWVGLVGLGWSVRSVSSLVLLVQIKGVQQAAEVHHGLLAERSVVVDDVVELGARGAGHGSRGGRLAAPLQVLARLELQLEHALAKLRGVGGGGGSVVGAGGGQHFKKASKGVMQSAAVASDPPA